jgi:putative membrane protein
MKKHLLAASAFAFVASMTPAFAQDPTTMTGSMSATDVGASPMTGTAATDYVKLAADSDNYEIQSSKLALTRSKRPDVKALAHQIITDHMQTSKALMAALSNSDRKIAPPPMTLSAANMAKIELLKKAPKASFDDLYLQQQMQAHQMAWSLHKGYATDGTDPALKQVASTAVPIIEMHLQRVKALSSSAMGGSGG